jgi:hypothetical protein
MDKISTLCQQVKTYCPINIIIAGNHGWGTALHELAKAEHVNVNEVLIKEGC